MVQAWNGPDWIWDFNLTTWVDNTWELEKGLLPTG